MDSDKKKKLPYVYVDIDSEKREPLLSVPGYVDSRQDAQREPRKAARKEASFKKVRIDDMPIDLGVDVPAKESGTPKHRASASDDAPKRSAAPAADVPMMPYPQGMPYPPGMPYYPMYAAGMYPQGMPYPQAMPGMPYEGPDGMMYAPVPYAFPVFRKALGPAPSDVDSRMDLTYPEATPQPEGYYPYGQPGFDPAMAAAYGAAPGAYAQQPPAVPEYAQQGYYPMGYPPLDDANSVAAYLGEQGYPNNPYPGADPYGYPQAQNPAYPQPGMMPEYPQQQFGGPADPYAMQGQNPYDPMGGAPVPYGGQGQPLSQQDQFGNWIDPAADPGMGMPPQGVQQPPAAGVSGPYGDMMGQAPYGAHAQQPVQQFPPQGTQTAQMPPFPQGGPVQQNAPQGNHFQGAPGAPDATPPMPPAADAPAAPSASGQPAGSIFDEPSVSIEEGMRTLETEHNTKRKKIVIISLIVVALAAIIVALFFIFGNGGAAPSADASSSSSSSSTAITASSAATGSSSTALNKTGNTSSSSSSRSSSSSSSSSSSGTSSNGAGTVVYQYSATTAAGVEYTVKETVTFQSNGDCEYTTMDMTFPDEASASAFVNNLARDYGSNFTLDQQNGANAVVTIDNSGLHLDRDEYENALRYSVDDLVILKK